VFRCVRNFCFLCNYSLCSCVLYHIVATLVFYSVLVLYLRTHSILKPTYVKDYKYYSRTYCCLVISFVPCHISSVQLTMKYHTVQKELWYFGRVEELLSEFCVSTCLYFLKTFCTPAALRCSSLHFRRRFKMHFIFCC
jgi:hypothetical protein